jgi:hypothetical protein
MKQLQAIERFATVVLGIVVLSFIPLAAFAANAVTPEQIKSLFDGNAMVIMFVWGLLHTRLPALANVPNALIPWVNLVGYILVKLAVPAPAAASIGGNVAAFGGMLWLVARAGATSAVTSLLYDKFVKEFIDKLVPKVV